MNAVVAEQNLNQAAHLAGERGLLRFITAGSVDDGKSTLIGRLLFDSKGIFADQLDAMSRAKHKRTVGDTIDLSLLTDGLEAEREQGITIDVAYRYFATPKRKFIIADTPGHEQYTRNMVTGASTADAVIILIDVSKVKLGDDGSVDLLIQTKRHSTIAHLLQIEHVVVAVNKMDLVNYDQTVYDRIVQAYREFAAQLGLKDIRPIPLSALTGDNVVTAGDNMPWYQGPTLIEMLESLTVYDEAHEEPLRFPVQLVARHNGHEADDFRGYMGRIEAGKVKRGDKLIVQPSGQIATVKDIQVLDASLESAVVGQSVTILLEEYLDISRGDMLVCAERPATLAEDRQCGCLLAIGRTARCAPQILAQTHDPASRRAGYQDRHTARHQYPAKASRRRTQAQRHCARHAERATAVGGRCLRGQPFDGRLHSDR